MTSITLRDVVADDEAFLLEVYASSREQEMALVPWTDDQRKAFLRMQAQAQDTYYRAQFPSATHQIILADDVAVGRLYVLRRDPEISILDITLLTQYRGQGIGGTVLRDILSEARAGGKTVSIYVESYNRSRGLFERMGFTRIGEEGINYLLEWRPANSPQ